MNTRYETKILTMDDLRPFSASKGKFISLRIFYKPYHWYAGAVDGYEIADAGTCFIAVSHSTRFEHPIQGPDIIFPGHLLIRIGFDRQIAESSDRIPRFKLEEPRCMVHPSFKPDTGILGIEHSEGFAHLSYRGQDMIAFMKFLGLT